ncbi:Aminotransferase-like [Macleaya cordata]|uniref:Aminotransferase-like n=1 Tax=Macleaya cordata TaxID=56857 RepID=A0A200R2I7_MACCD|nr:Aminotransferase-like [Macleaya cordata]
MTMVEDPPEAVIPQNMIRFTQERDDFSASHNLFHSHVSPTMNWETWMREIYANPDFVDRLKRAGIHDVILASKVHIHRDIQHLAAFVSRWCKDTYTCFLAWGELTITVEDVVSLLNLPTSRSVCPSRLFLNPVEEKLVILLERGILNATKEAEAEKSSRRFSFPDWIRYWCMTSKGASPGRVPCGFHCNVVVSSHLQEWFPF